MFPFDRSMQLQATCRRMSPPSGVCMAASCVASCSRRSRTPSPSSIFTGTGSWAISSCVAAACCRMAGSPAMDAAKQWQKSALQGEGVLKAAHSEREESV